MGIAGSLRSNGITHMAVRAALAGAAELGARTRLLDLVDYDLPFCPGYLSDEDAPEGVRRFRADLRRAQGIVLGTPEYHGGVSGLLKNALDLTGFAEFEGKMIGLIGVAAGQMGAVDALNTLRTVGRALHAWVVPQQAIIPNARQEFDADGQLRSADLAERVREVGRQVARFSRLHTSTAAADFLRQWEEAPPNPGVVRLHE